jgi:hypothetical protein
MWLIQIRALRKKLQLTLRRKGVSEKEKEVWRGRLAWEWGQGQGLNEQAKRGQHRGDFPQVEGTGWPQGGHQPFRGSGYFRPS